MKKIFAILATSSLLVACGQNAETPTKTPTNSGNIQAETPKTTEKKSTKITEKTDDFEIDLPENFTITKENDAYFIGKKGTNLVNESYFSISKYTKEEQEQMKKCESVKVPQTPEEFEKMTENEQKDYEPCQGPAMPTNPAELPVIHITEKGDFWLLSTGHEIPLIEKDANSYAETLKAFGVTEKFAKNNEDRMARIPAQLIQYFKENTRFEK